MPIYLKRFPEPPYPGPAVIVQLGAGDVGIGGRVKTPETGATVRLAEILFSRLDTKYEAGAELSLDYTQEMPVRIVIGSLAAFDVLLGQLHKMRSAMEHGPAEGIWIAEAPRG